MTATTIESGISIDLIDTPCLNSPVFSTWRRMALPLQRNEATEATLRRFAK
jgi:hypothetical protein